MKTEKQRIAIAGILGYRWVQPDDDGAGGLLDPKGKWLIRSWNKKASFKSPDVLSELPDVTNDLNACHEMEKVGQSLVIGFWTAYNAGLNIAKCDRLAHATAAQKCEAFLRTIGKWYEPTKTDRNRILKG